jgi:hypothetical protein
MLPTKFRLIWPSSYREDFQKSANQKQELPMVAMFVDGSEQNEQSLERTFHICFLQVSLHLAERFQRRRLKCEKLTDDGCQVMAKAHIAFGKVS